MGQNLVIEYWEKRSSLLSHDRKRDPHLCANGTVGHENSYNVVNMMIFKFLVNFVISKYRISIALKLSVDNI